MKWKQRFLQAFTIGAPVGCFMAFCQAVSAAEDVDMSPVLTPLDNLYTLVAAIISVVGGIFVLWFFVQMMAAINSHDTTQQINSVFKFACAFVIAVAPWILKNVLGI